MHRVSNTGVAAALGILTALCAVSLVAAEVADDTLRSNSNYAWPRQEQIVLDGPWELACTDLASDAGLPKNLDQLDWFPITVPTEVHWALHRAGKIPHPYVGLNAKSSRWVEDKSWWFRKRFAVPGKFRSKQIRLSVEGVDYFGRYWLNGQYLGRTEGAFGAAQMIVHNLKYDTPNELLVRVECGGYKLGREGGVEEASLVKSELWSGWRLGAHDLNTVGIWRPFRLISNAWPCLERPFVRTLEIDEGTAKVRATVEVCTLAKEESPCDIVVTLRPENGDAEPITEHVRIVPRRGNVLTDVDLTVPDAQLWWPNGLGEQPMYRAEIAIRRGDRLLDRLEVSLGIRTIERKAAPRERRTYEEGAWLFHVNGRPLFVKGTNWMPIDALADVSPERYEWHLTLARDAGIQMIRVWGGGIIETDAFYDLCDQLGIMVWQDFPMNSEWRAEKIDRRLWRNMVMWTIFRLRNHPSLAFWCGGNEFPPNDLANRDLVGIMSRYTRFLDGTRPFMAASPDEGDFHRYPQSDASSVWQSVLVRGPFVSEWGTHGMPSFQTCTEMLSQKEANAQIGPTLLTMEREAMEERFPEIIHHWVEFNPSRLPQMLARGSAFDQLAEVPLERFVEAVAAGAAEYYRYSAEAARWAYPQNAGLLFWVWKRPWPVTAVQICDGLGQPLSAYYDVRRAFGSPWPCLIPPHLNYVPGEEVEMKSAVLTAAGRAGVNRARLAVRLVGPDLADRQVLSQSPPLDLPEGPGRVDGPTVRFAVPKDAARSFFFLLVELRNAEAELIARNVYPLRCPPQLEDEAFRQEYRVKPGQGLVLDKGPWLRPQLETHPTTLALKLLDARRQSDTRATLSVEVTNTGVLPAVMTHVHVEGRLRYAADDAFFWLEPGETRRVSLRLRLNGDSPTDELSVIARAWNVPGPPKVAAFLKRGA